MELALHEAETRRVPELVTAAENGERVVITRHGEPAVELVCCHRKRGGIDFEKLDSDRRRLGIKGDEERWPEEFNDPSFSRCVLGLSDDVYASPVGPGARGAAPALCFDLGGGVDKPSRKPK